MNRELIQFEDLKDLLLGDLLGVGIHRKVGVYKLDPSLVIKCSLECPNINILEEEIWQMVRDTKIAKWFAPCISISQYGNFF